MVSADRSHQLPLPLGFDSTSASPESSGLQYGLGHPLMGAANQPLISALALLAANPGPLLLHGAPGLGKSHALRQFARTQASAGLRVQLIDARLFETTDMLEATLGLDVLLLDDVHLLAGRAHAERSLFALINRHVHDQQRTMVVASAKPVEELVWGLPDVRSRLMQWPCVELQPLSDDELMIAMQARAAMHGAHLEAGVCAWLLSHHSRDQGLLLDLVPAMEREALSLKRRLTLPFVRAYLSER